MNQEIMFSGYRWVNAAMVEIHDNTFHALMVKFIPKNFHLQNKNIIFLRRHTVSAQILENRKL